MRWELLRVAWSDKTAVLRAFRGGWEPFADSGTHLTFRRPTEASEGHAVFADNTGRSRLVGIVAKEDPS